MMSQSDYFAASPPAAGQRLAADRFRRDEMAGAGHATPNELSSPPARRHREGRPPRTADELQPGAAQPVPELESSSTPSATSTCGSRDGFPPPHGPPIVVENGTAGPRRVRQRDGRLPLAVRRRADHVRTELHRSVVLLHRRARDPVQCRATARALPNAQRLCQGGRQGHQGPREAKASSPTTTVGC